MPDIAAVLAQHDVIALVVLALIALLSRRIVPAGEQWRGPTVLRWLLLALALRAAAVAAEGTGAARMLGLAASFVFAMGAIALLLMAVFDLGLARAGVRVPSVLRGLAQWALAFLAGLALLRRAGVDLVSLVTTSAVVTAVIGFALQNMLANLFSGLGLHMEGTLRIGDWLQVGNRLGRIAEIGWRATSLLTRDGDLLVVPNSALVTGEVLNYSRPQRTHRTTFRVGFHYRHPPNEVKRMVVEAVHGVPGVLAVPEPDCLLDEFGDSAVTYLCRIWIDDMFREEPILDAARTRVWYGAARLGLEIPFPIRTLVMPHDVADTQRTERRSALARVELFAPLEDDDRELVADAMRRVRFAAGEEMIRQGEAGGSLYLVHEGEVAVRLSVDGVEREIAHLGPGQVVGEMSLMTGEPRTATCLAHTDVVCWVIDNRVLRPLLAARPKLVEEISLILARRQMELAGEREGLSSEARARARAAAERAGSLGERIRTFFKL